MVNNTKPGGTSGLSGSEIGGIVGGVLGAVILILLAVLLYRCWNSKARRDPPVSGEQSDEGIATNPPMNEVGRRRSNFREHMEVGTRINSADDNLRNDRRVRPDQ